MHDSWILQSLLSLGAGALASLSPCVYPMLPITVGALSNNRLGKPGIVAYLFGQTVTFVALGLMAVKLGEVFGFSSQEPWVQLGIALLLGALAFMGWKEWIPFRALAAPKPGSGPKSFLPLLTVMFATGAGSILVLSPCTTPVLSGVLTLVASESKNDWSRGVYLMTLYAVGFSSLFGALGLGFLKARHLPRAGKWLRLIQKVANGALLVTALYFLAQSARGFLGVAG